MATFSCEFGDVEKLFTQISVATSSIADDVLIAGAEVVVSAMKDAGIAAGYSPPGKSGRGTGRLLDSISYDKIKTSGDSKSIDIYPRGQHHKKTRNARVAFVLNYGRANLKGSHWLDNVKEASKEAATAAMIAKYNQLTSK